MLPALRRRVECSPPNANRTIQPWAAPRANLRRGMFPQRLRAPRLPTFQLISPEPSELASIPVRAARAFRQCPPPLTIGRNHISRMVGLIRALRMKSLPGDFDASEHVAGVVKMRRSSSLQFLAHDLQTARNTTPTLCGPFPLWLAKQPRTRQPEPAGPTGNVGFQSTAQDGVINHHWTRQSSARMKEGRLNSSARS